MNQIREQMEQICKMQNNRNAKFNCVTKCPWCNGELKMYEQNSFYSCQNCGRSGDINEVEDKLYKDMMEKPRGVKL